MRSTALLLFGLLNLWMAAGFPVRNHADQLAAQGITLRYRSSPAGIMENPPHFADWSQEELNEVRTSILEAGGKDALVAEGWAGNLRRTLKALWVFCQTEYPANSEPSLPQKGERANYFIAINTPQEADETDLYVSDAPNEAKQQETGMLGRAGLYLSHFSHMDPAIICSKFGPWIIGLCIFLLVPISVMIVEGIDRLNHRLTPEQFPDRGRGRERLIGHERQQAMLAKYEREKAVMEQYQKWWGQPRVSD